MVRIKPVKLDPSIYSPSNSPAQHPQTARNSWDNKILSNGDIEITIHGTTKLVPRGNVISLIKKFCQKGNRFAEPALEGRIYRAINREIESESDIVYNLCALYAALRSSGAYDSPYGGGRNSIFSIPAYLGCSRSPIIY